MTARLGNVLYWAGLIAAILLLLVGVILVWAGLLATDPWPGMHVFRGFILIVIAAVSYGIGWAARYILRGPRKDD